MKKTFLALMAASSLSLGACATTSNDTLADAATGAAVGAAGGAAVGAVVPGVSTITGAAVGAAVGGLAGAVWADNNSDGYADGYVQNGQYVQGAPSGWDSNLGRVATGVGVGAVAGAGIGALTGLGAIEGAVAGAVVGGLAGAIWADQDRDGRVDGYVQNGQYYPGAPAQGSMNQGSTYQQPMSTPTRSGERG